MEIFERVVSKLGTNLDHHARFVNSLSLLEYIGARKIIKSQPAESISAQLLSHASEEIRHAQIFKKIVLKMSNGRFDSYSEEHLLCGKQARTYIQSLDQGVAASLNSDDPKMNYLFTTLLIEERAAVVYPYYDSVLSKLGFSAALQAIIREETAHLDEMRAELSAMRTNPEERLASLRKLESSLFEEWMSACAQALDSPKRLTPLLSQPISDKSFAN